MSKKKELRGYLKSGQRVVVVGESDTEYVVRYVAVQPLMFSGGYWTSPSYGTKVVKKEDFIKEV
jgi:hypothetical protein